MLTHLYIKNFALIDKLDIAFSKGFSVITGETGAGKSIILGAIALLLGQRADSKSIKAGADKCTIEAHFDLSNYGMDGFFSDNDIDYDPSDCIIRRELTAAGKSRAFINDTPVSLSVLKELGEQLVDVHSQHQNLLLQKQDFQLSVVDIMAGNAAMREAYTNSYRAWKDVQQQLETFEADMQRDRQQLDFMQFQFAELDGARLQEGEQEELEQRSETMSHSEEIKQALFQADNAFSADEQGAVSQLRTALSALRSVVDVFPKAAPLAERLDSCEIELKDIAAEVGTLLEEVDFDPSELERVNDRLDRLYELQQKYRMQSVTTLIAERERLHSLLNRIENSDDALLDLRNQAAQLKQKCKDLASVLSAHRSRAAQQIQKQIEQRLVTLGMPSVHFSIKISQQPLSPTGADSVCFLFSANKSTPLQPIAQVASGGEIARVMLALKVMISGAVKLPTIIFDEIDTGVSGKIAEKMAEMMREMGHAERQVISITHLPQIAALGQTHYRVVKEETPLGTTSRMQLLSPDERVAEIAQMLSGSDISEAAMANARQLLGRENS